jgi:hypothetical protein
VNLLNEITQHRLGDFEIGDHSIFERANGDNAARGSTQHSFGLGADRKNFLTAALVSLLYGNDRRFVAHNPLIFNVDQCIGGPKIDGKIIGKDAKEGIEHQELLLFPRAEEISRQKISDLALPSKVMEKQEKM